ncbi:type II toxin-antitoxin system RelE/ParE family toxin [Mesorhizobium sp. KR2-14]|uniref:type II toxin-antitoxin system RelE/ParE family toxin n=1 Tax=Mesorhizobium sp. KR2-14 TaxID=3156610 RepID=UPI0032B5ADB5
MKFRLTKAADGDIAALFRETYRLFGENQLKHYTEIVQRGIAMIAEEPFRASSQRRDDLRAGVRSFHLQLAAGRHKGAAHVLYYSLDPSDGETVVVLRVLAEEMEPKKRIAQSLRAGEGLAKKGDRTRERE